MPLFIQDFKTKKMRTTIITVIVFGMLNITKVFAQTPEQDFKKTKSGMIIIGHNQNTRALAPFGGNPKIGEDYAEIINRYCAIFNNKVRVYSIVIPTAIAFYCPEGAKKYTHDESSAINNIYSHLSKSVKPIDVYSILSEHTKENIYLRTDHHWAPLAAYYAAYKFAEIAQVNFKNISEYKTDTVRNFVGTMYHYSKDISIKNAPENFIYYIPQDTSFITTYIKYIVNKSHNVIKESLPVRGKFFLHYRDGNSGAYCTFMGGDTRTVSIKTAKKNGRKLMILKDSYGNAIPGYLFSSFEEIHVIDFRYFNKSIVRYVKDNGITDILFANNLAHAYSPKTYKTYQELLDIK
jgi:hypothetical protein